MHRNESLVFNEIMAIDGLASAATLNMISSERQLYVQSGQENLYL